MDQLRKLQKLLRVHAMAHSGNNTRLHGLPRFLRKVTFRLRQHFRRLIQMADGAPADLLLRVRDHVVTDAVSRVGLLGIRAVLTIRYSQPAQIEFNFFPFKAKKRPYHKDALHLRFPHGRNASHPFYAGSPEQVKKQRLRPVTRMMGQGDLNGLAVLLPFLRQSFKNLISGNAPGFFLGKSLIFR